MKTVLRDMEAIMELSKFFDWLHHGYKEYGFDQTDIEPEGLIKDIFDMIAGVETGISQGIQVGEVYSAGSCQRTDL